MDTSKKNTFRRFIRAHYRTRGRDFPWRRTRDPYRILVSEVMLQQTQTDRVMQKYPQFLKAFPTISGLASAAPAAVLAGWRGLGYNRRALALLRLARAIVSDHGGKLPRDPVLLRELPGIGPYTASAVAAFAWDVRAPLIETNIRRAYIKWFFPRSVKVDDRRILRAIEETLPRRNVREWYYGLMDYGALLGRTEKANPNRRSAHYRVQSRFEGSDREVRGRILRILLARRKVAEGDLPDLVSRPPARVLRALGALEREGFLSRAKSGAITISRK